MPIGPALGAPRRFRSLVRWGLQVKPLGYHQRCFDAAVQGAAFPSSAGSTTSKLPYQILPSLVYWPVRITAMP